MLISCIDHHCATNIDECASSPCQNGGKCVDGINGYVCNCLPGYEQRHCGVNTDECASSPCQNGATCNDQINGYNCTCVSGYVGRSAHNGNFSKTQGDNIQSKYMSQPPKIVHHFQYSYNVIRNRHGPDLSSVQFLPQYLNACLNGVTYL